MSIEKIEIITLDHFKDDRGWLLKVLKQKHMGESPFGEIYITETQPGIIRANHYHQNTTEWFCVIRGTAKLVLQDIDSKERKEIVMGNAKFITVKIPSGVAHAIKNIGKETMYLVAIADQPYDSQNPDTYPHQLEI